MRTVFVDRDGVINANRSDHVTSWEQLELLPGSLDGLALLTRHGFQIVVVTNQAIVNRGTISQAALDEIHRRLIETVEQHGGTIAAVLACPHRPEEGCGCRKPAPGLLYRARDEHGATLDDAVLIGDHVTDLEAAGRAGCSSILVLSGRTAAGATDLPASCTAVLPDLQAAARYLVELVNRPSLKPVDAGHQNELAGVGAD
jgi:D-glycero-D-manno-heptose 1,7-bisphosphate phosphatase